VLVRRLRGVMVALGSWVSGSVIVVIVVVVVVVAVIARRGHSLGIETPCPRMIL
jgi:hypothetical protein